METILIDNNPEWELKFIKPSSAVCVNNEYNKLIVKITYDGEVEFGEGITPSEAARQFYTLVADLIKAGK